MEPIKAKEGFELELHDIEELEAKIAPDGGETVLPLASTNGGGNGHGHGH